MLTDKMSTDKISTDIMSNRPNIGQAKCRQTKCLQKQTKYRFFFSDNQFSDFFFPVIVKIHRKLGCFQYIMVFDIMSAYRYKRRHVQNLMNYRNQDGRIHTTDLGNIEVNNRNDIIQDRV